MTYHFIDALDVLHFRGNKLFGAAGSYGETAVLPRPSVVAGALRSALLVHKGLRPEDYAQGKLANDPELGRPDTPGTFGITHWHLAQREANGQVTPLYPPPADLVFSEDGNSVAAQRMRPQPAFPGVETSAATDKLAVLAQPRRVKPAGGFWLNAEGWQCHLAGESVSARKHLVPINQLWATETRIGIGLDTAQRSASTGQLFSTEAVALRRRDHACGHEPAAPDTGFLVGTTGANLPDELLLRLGGDGRAAVARQVAVQPPAPDLQAIAERGQCRLILTSPGLFPQGWRPTGMSPDSALFELGGVRGRLVCAAVPRAEVVSGWDLAKGQPKPAQRAASAGSVYWLEDLQATADQLQALMARGLWPDDTADRPDGHPDPRRAEGYNRFVFAAY